MERGSRLTRNSMSTAINTRMGAQALVESNVFKNVKAPVESADSKEQG
jgi:pectate lyase